MSSFVELSTATASNSGSVTLTGITSSYNVAVLFYSDVVPATDTADLTGRFTQGGSPNSNSNYVSGLAYARSDRSFISSSGDNLGLAGRSSFSMSGSTDNSSTSGHIGVAYIYRANDSSENTYLVMYNNYLSSGGTQIMLGQFQGTILKEQTTVDGIQIFFDSGNITKGNFVLYGLKE
mgnify:FL=1|jgi:hypothetical protein|tara:strand:+ start:1067 stop:1600 length:534 start_codon:yes stop_codon:yes gene_type:complete